MIGDVKHTCFYMAYNVNCDLKQTFTPHKTCIFFLFCQRHRDLKLVLHFVAERNLIKNKNPQKGAICHNNNIKWHWSFNKLS